MKTIESKALDAGWSHLLDAVAQGECFTIVVQGTPVATLKPVDIEERRREILAALEEMREFRKGRMLDGLSIREMIEEGRRF